MSKIFAEALLSGFEELSAGELYDILQARAAVFVVEQNCAYQEVDEADRSAIHLWLREGEEIVVSAKAFAKHVCIESEDPDLLLSDNFFDLNGDEKRVRILRGSAETLRVRSVYDLDESHA